MAERYQHLPNRRQKLRVNRSTIWRRQMKEKNPEKYRRYLEQQRVRSQVARQRLKLAISMVKNSPMKAMKTDRQKRFLLDKNSSQSRETRLANLPNDGGTSEKTGKHKIVLDKLSQRISVFKMSHILPSGVHLEAAQTLGKISLQYLWPTMREDVTNWVSDCKVCGKQSTHIKNNIMVQPDSSSSWGFTTSSNLDDNNGAWSKESTKILLQAVAEIFGRRSIHIQTELELWTEIANNVNLHGNSVSAITCKLKWQEMKKLYFHFKTGTLSQNPSQSWSLYNLIDMVHNAFQTLTNKTNMPPKFPFTSIFESNEVDMEVLSKSNLAIDCQIDQSNFPLGMYRNLYNNTLVPKTEVDQVNMDQNLELTEICESNPMSGKDHKNNFDLFDSTLKVASSRQYWGADQLQTVAQGSFEMDTNVNNPTSGLILPLAADFNATVDVITASELQQEIKQECDGLVEPISFPSVPATSVQANSLYVDTNHLQQQGVMTFKTEPDENHEHLQIQSHSKSNSNRTTDVFPDEDVLCLDLVASEPENYQDNNRINIALPSCTGRNEDIQNNSQDLNTVDLTYLSPEPDISSVSFSEDHNNVVTFSKDDSAKNNCSIATTNLIHQQTSKTNMVEEKLKRAETIDIGNTRSPISISSNMIDLGGLTDKNEDIPTWFQEFMKEQKQHAAKQAKQTKDFHDSVLGLIRETNQHLATLIFIQRNEMKEKEKKDDELKNTLLEILKEKCN